MGIDLGLSYFLYDYKTETPLLAFDGIMDVATEMVAEATKYPIQEGFLLSDHFIKSPPIKKISAIVNEGQTVFFNRKYGFLRKPAMRSTIEDLCLNSVQLKTNPILNAVNSITTYQSPNWILTRGVIISYSVETSGYSDMYSITFQELLVIDSGITSGNISNRGYDAVF